MNDAMASAVEVTDESGDERITPDHHEDVLKLCAALYGQLHLGPAVELAVTLIDAQRMESLHREWMDLPDPTDVMSFPLDELRPGTAQAPVTGGMLGDIVICPEVAAAQAASAGHDLRDELLLLTTHGVLHLLGYDHGEPEERAEMFALQRELLSGYLGRPAPTPTEA